MQLKLKVEGVNILSIRSHATIHFQKDKVGSVSALTWFIRYISY